MDSDLSVLQPTQSLPLESVTIMNEQEGAMAIMLMLLDAVKLAMEDPERREAIERIGAEVLPLTERAGELLGVEVRSGDMAASIAGFLATAGFKQRERDGAEP